jgi:transposase
MEHINALDQDSVFNSGCVDFANYYGFAVTACAVGKGNEKGCMKSGCGYVKKNFLAGLNISDFKLINPARRKQHTLQAPIRSGLHPCCRAR